MVFINYFILKCIIGIVLQRMEFKVQSDLVVGLKLYSKKWVDQWFEVKRNGVGGVGGLQDKVVGRRVLEQRRVFFFCIVIGFLVLSRFFFKVRYLLKCQQKSCDRFDFNIIMLLIRRLQNLETFCRRLYFQLVFFVIFGIYSSFNCIWRVKIIFEFRLGRVFFFLNCFIIVKVFLQFLFYRVFIIIRQYYFFNFLYEQYQK